MRAPFPVFWFLNLPDRVRAVADDQPVLRWVAEDDREIELLVKALVLAHVSDDVDELDGLSRQLHAPGFDTAGSEKLGGESGDCVQQPLRDSPVYGRNITAS